MVNLEVRPAPHLAITRAEVKGECRYVNAVWRR
jgi:hypothetical protein